MATEKRLIDAIKRRLECHMAKAICWGVDNIPMGKDSSSSFEYLRGYERGAFETANLVLGMIPADTAEVVHGRWEWMHEDFYNCTHCGTINHVKEVMGRPDFNYCPDCGAKMDGDGNGKAD